ncbi:winged helix-turn-helix domain-containing protein [Paramicrobacterium fandaimingii]|uniref:winged helix-turn-helix domain-containing protein n=1 Tax=Paramicrobacterium fandaimingii TaxID=2708079 RepID=UPI001420B53A|nr:winged helix-turn-helix domain-containing protein [Microbacterium fandaimingii]
MSREEQGEDAADGAETSSNLVSNDAHTMTSAMLKAMTHPLRRQLVRSLSKHIYARAADLAQELNVPANSVSFHLRVLANAGLISEAPEKARDKRDRVWTPMRGSLNVGSPEYGAEDIELAGALVQTMIEDHFDLVKRSSNRWRDYVAGQSTQDLHTTMMHLNVPMDAATAKKFFETISRMATEAAETFDVDSPNVHVWEIDVLGADDTV